MVVLRPWILIISAMLLCVGCTLKDLKLPQFRSEGEQSLSTGIKLYEEANYEDATQYLQRALSKGLKDKDDQIKAHKYLAFIYCVSGRKKKCSSEFKEACKLDPNFELQPAEAGHPIWGPVFRSVKAKTDGDKK